MRRMFRATRWFVTLGVVVLGSLAPAWAQSTATLQGTITDTQSAVMPGVSVTIRNQATGIERATVTDAAGQYVAASLQPGHYAIVAHIEGFQDQTREVDLSPAQTVELNLRLGVAALAENVTVSGSSPRRRSHLEQNDHGLEQLSHPHPGGRPPQPCERPGRHHGGRRVQEP